jgi:hypothetical protein
MHHSGGIALDDPGEIRQAGSGSRLRLHREKRGEAGQRETRNDAQDGSIHDSSLG